MKSKEIVGVIEVLFGGEDDIVFFIPEEDKELLEKHDHPQVKKMIENAISMQEKDGIHFPITVEAKSYRPEWKLTLEKDDFE